MEYLVGTVHSVTVGSAGPNSSGIEFVLRLADKSTRSFWIIPLRPPARPKPYLVEQHALASFAAVLGAACASKTAVRIVAVQTDDSKGTAYVTSVGMPASAFGARRSRGTAAKRKSR